jgi:hypothetical protein
MIALDYADQVVTLNYDNAAPYLARQEEVCLKAINKAIEATFLDHGINANHG